MADVKDDEDLELVAQREHARAEQERGRPDRSGRRVLRARDDAKHDEKLDRDIKIPEIFSELEPVFTPSTTANLALANLQRASRFVDEQTTAQDLARGAVGQLAQDIVQGIKDERDDDPTRPLDELETRFNLPLRQVDPQPQLFDPGVFQRVQESTNMLRGQSARTIIPQVSITEVNDYITHPGVLPLEIKDFSIQAVKEAIGKHIRPKVVGEDEFGRDITINVIDDDQDRVVADLRNIIQKGLEFSLASDSPRINSERILSTVGSAINQIVAESGVDSVDLIELSELATSTMVGLTGIRSVQKQAIFLPQHLVDLFPAHMEALLNTKKLSLPQREEIIDNFNKKLFEFKTRARQGDILSIQDELTSASDYINGHVSNDNLREEMIRKISITRENLGVFFGELGTRGTPNRIPLTEVRNIEITKPQTKAIIGSQVGRLMEAGVGALRALFIDRTGLEADLKKQEEQHQDPGSPRFSSVDIIREREIRTNLSRGITKLNRLSNKHHLRIQNIGEPSLPFQIFLRNIDNTQKNSYQLLDELKQLQAKISNAEIRFSRLPDVSEDNIISDDDFRNGFSTLDLNIKKITSTKTRSKEARHKKKTIVKHTGKTKIGNIRILSDENRTRKEIIIPSTTKIGDMLKLAAALSMEAGILEDHDGHVLIKIRKHQDIKAIIKRLMEELDKNAGHDIKLLWVGHHPTGGMFLNGILSPAFSKPFTTPAIGGAISHHGKHIPNPIHAITELPISIFTRFK